MMSNKASIGGFLNRSLFDNPIAAAELNHLRQSKIKTRRWRHWVDGLFLQATLALSLALYGGYLLIAITGAPIHEQTPLISGLVTTFDRPLVYIFSLTAIGWHFTLMLRTLALASHTVTREKAGNTWELLRLTSITPARLVWGKWWGVVQQQIRPYLRLTLFSLGAISWITLVDNVSVYGNYAPLASGEILVTYYPSPFSLLLSGVILGLVMLLSLSLAAVCGVMGGVLVSQWVGAVVWAVFIRVLLPVFFLVIRTPLLRTVSDMRFAWYDVDIGIFMLVDSGLVLTTFETMAANYEWQRPGVMMPQAVPILTGHELLSISVAILIFVLSIGFIQFLSVHSITRSGAERFLRTRKPLA